MHASISPVSVRTLFLGLLAFGPTLVLAQGVPASLRAPLRQVSLQDTPVLIARGVPSEIDPTKFVGCGSCEHALALTTTCTNTDGQQGSVNNIDSCSCNAETLAAWSSCFSCSIETHEGDASVFQSSLDELVNSCDAAGYRTTPLILGSFADITNNITSASSSSSVTLATTPTSTSTPTATSIEESLPKTYSRSTEAFYSYRSTGGAFVTQSPMEGTQSAGQRSTTNPVIGLPSVILAGVLVGMIQVLL